VSRGEHGSAIPEEGSLILRVTVDAVIAWDPCSEYSRDRIESLFAGRHELSAVDIIELEIPIDDRLWAAVRTDLIDESTIRLWSADCAERVLGLFEKVIPDDNRPRQAIEAARAYARGTISIEEMYAAWSAAWDAHRDAAWDAERDAAGDAERDAAGDAAWSAAWSSAVRAAWSAAWSAAVRAGWSAERDAAWSAAGYAAVRVARDAEREWQCDQLLSRLRGGVQL